MKNILVIGNRSKISKKLIFPINCFNIFYTSRKNLDKKSIFFYDLNDFNAIDTLTIILNKTNPDFVIWSIGETNIYKCQTDSSTYDLNVIKTKLAIKLISDRGINLIYFSSNAVFSCNSQISDENEPYSPSCEYGLQKKYMEEFITKECKNIAIIRLSKLISLDDNLFKSFIEKDKLKQEINLYSDIFISPISYNYLNKFLLTLLNSYKAGIFHLSSDFELNYVTLIGILRNHNLLQLTDKLIKNRKNTSAIFKPKFPVLPMKNTSKIFNTPPLSVEQFLKDLN